MTEFFNTSTNGMTGTFKKNCHTGNTRLYTEPNGGGFFIGGWNNGAWFDFNTHVIDLTGDEHKWASIPMAFDESSKDFMEFLGTSYAGWLSLPFPDMKVPANLKTYEQWHGIAMKIRRILQTGNDVLVACHGGHGRSGLFCAIVGYILGVDYDRSWSSPVEKVRKVHCFEAVETRAQEQYVYDILGLDIEVKTVFTFEQPKKTWDNWKPCPICGTQSNFVDDMGMCLGCERKYKLLAPKKDSFTAADLKTKGEVDHACKEPDCIGIWTASKCGHTVHNMLIIDGWCEYCNKENESHAKIAAQSDDDAKDPCVICEKASWYSDKFGVCYECSEHIITSGTIDFVHNTITDPYRAVPHHCMDDACVGVVVADVCGHVVHNREVEDGVCTVCKANSLGDSGRLQ